MKLQGFLVQICPLKRYFPPERTGGGGYEGCGGFLERKPIPTVGEEIPPKNFAQGFVGEDIILPKTIPLRKKNGRTGDTGNFLKRKFPEPFKEFVRGLRE